MGDEWSGAERREACKACKGELLSKIGASCNKSKMALTTTLLFIIICFLTIGISYSAKSTSEEAKREVASYRQLLEEVHQTQKDMMKELTGMSKFINLLEHGMIDMTKVSEF